jgi:L-aminopeptidase/D-esterase-like protein
MKEIHAVVLTGGSAFGLASADGVMRYLEEREIGYKTPWARVPIVPAAVLFDLNIGSSTVRPNAESGYMACKNASPEISVEGNVGAGTGATVGKWSGTEGRMKGGFGCATLSHHDIMVSAVAAVNAVGDILDEGGNILAGARSETGLWMAVGDPLRSLFRSKPALTNTTLVVVMTNARLSKVDTNRMAQRGHDGMSRATKPAHTSYDGDTVFALASGSVEASLDLVAEMGADATAEAIRSAIRAATSAGGVPAMRDRELRR